MHDGTPALDGMLDGTPALDGMLDGTPAQSIKKRKIE
jgi:hypothetical protein